MKPGASIFQPGRAKDNSPSIYRWDSERSKMSSPGGTKELCRKIFSFAPDGACGNFGQVNPAINRWAIFGRPGGTSTNGGVAK